MKPALPNPALDGLKTLRVSAVPVDGCQSRRATVGKVSDIKGVQVYQALDLDDALVAAYAIGRARHVQISVTPEDYYRITVQDKPFPKKATQVQYG